MRPLRGLYCAARKNIASFGAVAQNNVFTVAGKNDIVMANHRAAA